MLNITLIYIIYNMLYYLQKENGLFAFCNKSDDFLSPSVFIALFKTPEPKKLS